MRPRSRRSRSIPSARRLIAAPRGPEPRRIGRARDLRGPQARGLQQLVRAVSALRRAATRAARQLQGRRGAPAVRRRDGLRRRCTSRPSSRSDASTARGRTTRSRRSPATSAAPGPSAPRRAATRRSCRSSARSRISGSLVGQGARARHRDRARHRLPMRARSSLRERASRSGSSTAPTAACSTRRTRRRNTRTSTPSISRPTTGAPCGTELKSVVDFWIEQGVRIFRVDNPHTKPFRVLGMADRRDPARASRT